MSRPSSRDGEDLSTILDESQRADVTLLIAKCTDAMRTLLMQNFDPAAGLDKSLFSQGETDEEKFMNADPSTANVEAYDKERKLKEECENDVNTPQAKKLKTAALKSFDEWREQVMLRVGEAVNAKSKAKDQLESDNGPMSPKPKAPTTIGKITDVPDRNPNLKFKDLFPPTKTPLTKLPMDRRTLILHALLLLLISLEHYNAYSRILMLNLTSSLKLPLRTFEQDEYTTAKGLLESAKELSADQETQKKQEANRENRKWKVGLATAAGAAILGVSGGLAAPLVASGVGSVMGGLGLGATAAAGYLGSVAGSTLLVGGLFGAYGGRMTGQMMDKYAREVEDFEFLPVHSDNKTSEDQEQGAQEASEHDHKLRVTICVSGWLTEKSEVTKPWRVLGTGAEVFALKWELEALLNLGHAMDGMMQSAAWGYAQKELIKRTIFADLMSAFWPMGLLKVARVLDNPFSVAKARADKAGEVLADALINKAQGERPVTLIGYSLGARLIYTCLKTLAERKAFGLVENAVIIGAPAPSDMSDWRVLRTAVSGRLINVYSQNDYLLGFMYRTSALQYGIAGLQPIRGLAGIENVDISEDIDGHTRYRFLVGGILKKIGFEDIDNAAVDEEREALEKMLKDEKKNSLQAQRKRLMRRESYKDGKVDEDQEAEEEATDMENQVKDKTQKSLMARVIEWWYTPSKKNEKDTEQAAKNLQKAVQDPADAKDAATSAVKDAQASTQSYTAYIASKLPSMPGSSPTKAEAATGKAKEATEKATGTTSTYMETAQSYMPSLPSFGSKTEPKKPETASEKASYAAKQAGAGAQKGVTGAADITKDVVQPTVNNALNPKDNPAVKAAKDTVKQAPIIHQASDRVPGANKAAQVTSDTVGTTAQNTTQTLSGAINTSASKADEAGTSSAKAATKQASSAGQSAMNAASTVTTQLTSAGKSLTPSTRRIDASTKQPTSPPPSTPGAKPQQQQQSYLSLASSYIPSTSPLPSLPFSNKRGPPKLSKRGSTPATPSTTSTNTTSAKPPQPQRTPSGVKFPQAKLEGTPSGAKSPASGLKSPPPKLDRQQSGMKSPASGAKSPASSGVGAGVKSPPSKLARTPSGVKSRPPKLDRVDSGLRKVKDQTQTQKQTQQEKGSWAGMAKGAVGGVVGRVPGLGGR